jgi:GNAT superfamily N-acetyltransferase
MIQIKRAHQGHLNELVHLFDAYRMFYKKESNLEGAKHFLSERMQQKESIIFVALMEEKLVGFTQLYPLFSSTNMMPILLLNDLFVAKEHRGKQISKGLIKAAQEHCKITKANGISLETEKNNIPGNALYPKMGFTLDQEHNFYYWENPTASSS